MLCTGREISFFTDGSRVAIDPDIIYDANGGRAFAHNLKLLGPTVKSITGPPSTKCCLEYCCQLYLSGSNDGDTDLKLLVPPDS